MRAKAVMLACALVGLLGLTGTTLAGSAMGAPEVRPAQPVLAQPAPAQPAMVRPVSRVSTATRHVPTPAESALTGAMHPATDRVMALLIGWVLLAILGGGLLAPRR